MKLLNVLLCMFAVCLIACGDEESSESGPQSETRVEFEITGSEGYALTSAAVFIEPCPFGEDGESEVLVLTPWQLDCNGPKINTAPANWKAVTITLEDGCGYDLSMSTAEQTTETFEDGSMSISYQHGHSHDFSVTSSQRTLSDNGTEMLSLEIDIFEKFQGQGGEAIGFLKASEVSHCGTKASDPAQDDWWRPSNDG